MSLSVLAALSVLLLPARVFAQGTYTETVYGSVIFTRHGENIPWLSSGFRDLTPLGATEMFAAGSFFRNRYMETTAQANSTNSTSNFPIIQLSQDVIDNSQIFALSTDDAYVSASAMSFFQGLYPPLDSSTVITAPSILANGSNVISPLGGYQYPAILSASVSDPNSVFVAGDSHCPRYSISGADYYVTPEFKETQSATDDFYHSFYSDILAGVLRPELVGYINAMDIYEYMAYGSNHNSTISSLVNSTALDQLRLLADRSEFALNGNLSASGFAPGDQIRAVAGRMFASQVVRLLAANIETNGSLEKLSTMFGSYQPFLAFFALAQLTGKSANFYGVPKFGSSMVFELYSVNGSTTTYPAEADLKVRFLFRNGTADDAELISYPLFGRGNSETDMSWADFVGGMDDIILSDVGSWCGTCASSDSFCTAYLPSVSDDSNSHKSSKMDPQVAGVIGAAVTIGVFLLVLAAAMLLGGLRFYRHTTRPKSDLGGFKGAEKLASDADLTLVKASPAAAVKGHERVGSWELKDSNAAQGQFGAIPASGNSHTRNRADDDDVDRLSVNPFSEPVKIDDRV